MYHATFWPRFVNCGIKAAFKKHPALAFIHTLRPLEASRVKSSGAINCLRQPPMSVCPWLFLGPGVCVFVGGGLQVP